jgi:hypothetical protein
MVYDGFDQYKYTGCFDFYRSPQFAVSVFIRPDIMRISAQQPLSAAYTFYLFTISDTLGVLTPTVRGMRAHRPAFIFTSYSSLLRWSSLVQLTGRQLLWRSYGSNSISSHFRQVLTTTDAACGL